MKQVEVMEEDEQAEVVEADEQAVMEEDSPEEIETTGATRSENDDAREEIQDPERAMFPFQTERVD